MVSPNRRRTRTLVAACVAMGLGISACSSSTPAAVTTTTAASASQYYVSLGDSYAAGYQPTGPKSVGHTTTNGFAYQLPGLASARGYHLTLVNFGCGGATTESILHNPGCPQLGPGAPPYPTQTQAAAAEAFLTRHPGKIGLVTVSIGGNDLTDCASNADPISCVGKAVTTINADLGVLLPALRAAAGPTVPIVGTTYPDVILGDYLSANPSLKSLASLSVTAFMDLINPALQKDYAAVGGSFVDVTAATGAYTPFSQTTTLAPYGTIPVAVARVCQLTFFCQYQDIHPRTVGYTEIATLIAGTLPTR
jgi:lysophospholipase L1-like esterase